MAIYTSKFTQQEIDDGIDKANDALPSTGGTITTSKAKFEIIGSIINVKTLADTRIAVFGSGTGSPSSGSELGYLSLFHNGSVLVQLYATTAANEYSWINVPRLGIGTDSPTEKLDVVGNLKVRGTISAKSESFYKSTPSLGSMAGTISFLGTSANGTALDYGLFIWTDRWSGQTSLQSAYNGGETDPLPISLQPIGGNVGIGFTGVSADTLPSYKLHVAGAVGATGYNNTSDIRKKDIIENINLNVEDIANAPLFKFSWLDPEMPEGVNVGTSAQYWQTIIPEIVSEANDDEKTLSMQYGVAGLASSIALARKVVEQENTIKAQEARIKALEDAIAEIQNKLK